MSQILIIPVIKGSNRTGAASIVTPLHSFQLGALLLQLRPNHRIRRPHLIRRNGRAVDHHVVVVVCLILHVQIILVLYTHWLPLILPVQLVVVDVYFW